ncbi:MAG: hypothetical protein AAGH92_09110 [Planctomycetota bacterium]
MELRDDPNLILAYVEGELSEAEAERFEQRCQADASLASLVRDLKADRDALRGLPSEALPAGTSPAEVAVGQIERSLLLGDGMDAAGAIPAAKPDGSSGVFRILRYASYTGLAAALGLTAVVVVNNLTGTPLNQRGQDLAVATLPTFEPNEALDAGDEFALGDVAEVDQTPETRAEPLPSASDSLQPTAPSSMPPVLAEASGGEEMRALMDERSARAPAAVSETESAFAFTEAAVMDDTPETFDTPADLTTGLALARSRIEVSGKDADGGENMQLKADVRAGANAAMGLSGFADSSLTKGEREDATPPNALAQRAIPVADAEHPSRLRILESPAVSPVASNATPQTVHFWWTDPGPLGVRPERSVIVRQQSEPSLGRAAAAVAPSGPPLQTQFLSMPVTHAPLEDPLRWLDPAAWLDLAETPPAAVEPAP